MKKRLDEAMNDLSQADKYDYNVVNEDVDADDISGFETPRELSIHIIKLEQEKKTSPTSPYP